MAFYGERVGLGLEGSWLVDDDVLMESIDKHEEIGVVMTIFPMMVVEEVEPPTVMEASSMLMEGLKLRDGLSIAVRSINFTTTMLILPVEVLASQWPAKDGGFDITEAGELALVVDSIVEVTVLHGATVHIGGGGISILTLLYYGGMWHAFR